MAVPARHRDLASIRVEIEAYGHCRAVPRCKVLVEEHTQAVVKAVEVPGVVHVMVAVAVVHPGVAVGAAVAVCERQRCLATGYVLVVYVSRAGV